MFIIKQMKHCKYQLIFYVIDTNFDAFIHAQLHKYPFQSA